MTCFTRIAAVAAMLSTVPAHAEVPVSPESVGVRIDLAGRQRMLSQQMAKWLCYARAGVDPILAIEGLTRSKSLYEETHAAFRNGSDSLMLFPEADPSALESWNNVDLLWLPLQQTYDRALSGNFVTEDEFDRTMRLTTEVMARNNEYVAQLRAVYADDIGAAGLGGAILIDLYGRQRMLSQKLSKEVCLASRGHQLDATRAELQETLRLFEASLTGFIDGLPIAGIPAAPTEEIRAQLEVARGIWTPIRGIVSDVAAGRAASLSELSEVAIALDAFLPEMNKAVNLLIEYEVSLPAG